MYNSYTQYKLKTLSDNEINKFVESGHILRSWEKKKIRQIQKAFKLNQKDAVHRYMDIKGKLFSLFTHPAIDKSNAIQYIQKFDFIKHNYDKIVEDGTKHSIALKKSQYLDQFK